MATFRNAQIDEILNNERTMNRVILDREIAHASSIGDERAPPTTRDIKNEALIGSMIDNVKEKINKAIQAVTAFTYSITDESKAARLSKLSTKNMDEVPIIPIEKQEDKSSKVPNTSGKAKPDSDNTDELTSSDVFVPIEQSVDTEVQPDE